MSNLKSLIASFTLQTRHCPEVRMA